MSNHIQDAIEAAKASNPTDVRNAVDSALQSKLADALDLKKVEISTNLIIDPVVEDED